MACVLSRPSMDFSSINLPGCVFDTYNPCEHPTCTTASGKSFHCVTRHSVKKQSPFVYFEYPAHSFHLMSWQPLWGLLLTCGHARCLSQAQRPSTLSFDPHVIDGFCTVLWMTGSLGKTCKLPFLPRVSFLPRVTIIWDKRQCATISRWNGLTNNPTFGILHISLPPFVVIKHVLDALHKWSLFKFCSEKERTIKTNWLFLCIYIMSILSKMSSTSLPILPLSSPLLMSVMLCD